MLNKKNLQSGVTLPTTIVFSLVGSLMLFSYTLKIYEKDFQVEFKIAETKALYNAESGIALSAYSTIFRKDYIPSESDTLDFVPIENMGAYSIGIFEGIDPEFYTPIRGANSTGYAYVKHLLGKKSIRIERQKKLNIGNTSSLADYLWLTDSELAGGAPWVFDNGIPSLSTRRENNWGSGDNLNGGWGGGDPICDVGFQTNGTFVTSQFGNPVFDITVSVVEDDEGLFHDPIIQSGNESQIFQGDPGLDTVKTTCLPPPGYEIMKRVIENSNDHYTFDATEKLNFNSVTGARDTLIMTDIEFFTNNGQDGFKVKQWWFLKPPYFKSDFPSAQPFMYSFLIDEFAGDCGEISGNSDIRTCPNYIEQLANFHSRAVNPSNGQDSYIPPDNWGIVSGNHGFQHYDFPAIYEPGNWTSQFEIDNEQPFSSPDQLLPEYAGGAMTFTTDKPTAIYVKGGPVRVNGRYKGKYTIVTDEHTTYHRHAWASDINTNLPTPCPIDTLWNNIWITDDIINNDAQIDGNGRWSLLNAQPDSECNEGSENNLGLVSGANVIVANTIENGARDCSTSNCSDNDRSNIDIHAHIIAFNESFTVQYSNNTYASAGGNPWSNPPFGDGQGIDKFGNSPNDDTRGTVNIWGGMVQMFRGYIVRNNPGPYNLANGNIGYPGKEYNFDCNLKCSFPPLYPENTTCDEAADELPWSITAYY